ncbi:MAG: CapA family protein [Gudongella sp.]|jgi:poly-gamma-glutamate synthesis protein (capsule biosynthesis protein)|nr:CapA family protein [Gudongella sp.]
MKRWILPILAILLIASGVLLSGMAAERFQTGEAAVDENVILEPEIDGESVDVAEEEFEPEPSSLRIIAVGDIMFHIPQINSAADEEGGFNFEPPFTFVKSYIDEADIAIANLETVIASSGGPYRGFPRFNSPVETLDALKSTGFDILTTANNHTLDQGKTGLINTINEIEKRNFVQIGTSKTERKDYEIVEKNGISIAFFAYTYGLNGLDSLLSKDELSTMVNLIDKDRMADSILQARAEGAELIVVSLHWGYEYHTRASTIQRDLAEFLINNGTDIILGSHPHVVQEVELLETETNTGLVIYSMGNFISNQRYETMGVSATENGLMVMIDIEKDLITENIEITSITPLVTWVDRYETNGKYDYRIVPIEEALSGNLDMNLTDGKEAKLKKSLEEINSLIDENITF